MTLSVLQFVTLDGVSQGPGAADEDTSGGFTRGGWLVPHMDQTFVQQAAEWLALADGLLLGRRTYEAFARDWPQITDPNDPFTARMNSLPKYVVTSTLTEGNWSPTTLLSGDPLAAVAALKAEVQPGRELQVHGSTTLAGALLSAGLVDVLRLVLAPTIVGDGRQLLTQPASSLGLRLTGHQATPSGLLLLEYATTGEAPRADYAGVAAIA